MNLKRETWDEIINKPKKKDLEERLELDALTDFLLNITEDNI